MEDQSKTCSTLALLSSRERRRCGLDSGIFREKVRERDRERELELELARKSAGTRRRPLGVEWRDPVSTVEVERENPVARAVSGNFGVGGEGRAIVWPGDDDMGDDCFWVEGLVICSNEKYEGRLARLRLRRDFDEKEDAVFGG